MTNAEITLRYIAEHPEGLKLSDIQLWYVQTFKRDQYIRGEIKVRNWYLGTLYDACFRAGILNKYCTKLPNGRWIVTEPIKGPFTSWKHRHTKSWKQNLARKRGEEILRTEALPTCPACWKPLHSYVIRSQDKQACAVQTSLAFLLDCKDRVWRYNDLERGGLQNMTLTTLSKSQLVEIEKLAEQAHRADWEKERKFVWDMVGLYLVKEDK